MPTRRVLTPILAALLLGAVLPQSGAVAGPAPERWAADDQVSELDAVLSTALGSHAMANDATDVAASPLATAPGWGGDRTIAVILVNFWNDRSRPFTRAFANGVMFTNPDSVRAYYAAESDGAISLQGTTFDWITLPMSNRTCRPKQWAAAAEARLRARHVDLRRFTNFMFMFPATRSCPWRGYSDLPGSRTWINGTPNLRTPAHELAHNFGVHHASTIRCTSHGAPVALSGHCTHDEYGDPFTTMGASKNRLADNLELAQMGDLPASSAATVQASGTYRLAPTFASNGVRIIGIPRGDGTWLYLEYRRPSGTLFDDFSAADPSSNGVTLRLAGSWTAITESELIDTHPRTATFADAPLAVGGSFTDYLTGTSISVVSIDDTSATVAISVGTRWIRASTRHGLAIVSESGTLATQRRG